MKIQNPLHLAAKDMLSIEPTGYSITSANEVYQQFWTISLIGNRQAFLSDSNSNTIKFTSREEAETYGKEHWPDLPLIAST